MFALSALLLALTSAPDPESTPPFDKAEKAVALLKEFCLTEASVREKSAQLVRAGWSNRASSGRQLFEGEAPLEAFGNGAFPQMVIVLTAPAADRDRMTDCVVDGKDIDVRSLIRVAVREFGKPEQQGTSAIWSIPELHRSIIAAPSHVLGHENKDAAFMLLVRFGPPPKVRDQN
jgi:hypothetical protein